MNETSKLKKRRSELEAELKVKKADKIEIEKSLSKAYAAADDSAPILKKLTLARDEIQGICGALSQLDETIYQTQLQEHTELSEKLNNETNKKFANSIKQTESALKPMVKLLSGFMPKDNVQPVIQQITEAAKVAIWESLQNEESIRYNEEVPTMPVKPWLRDAEGVPHEEPVHVFGR